MKIDQKTYNAMPPHLQSLFNILPNPSKAEVTACFPVTGPSKQAERGKGIDGATFKNINGQTSGVRGHDDNGGSAARFFATCPPDEGDEFTRLYYTAKASKRERNQGLEGMEAKIYNDGRDEDLDSGRFPANRGNEPKVNGHPTVKSLSLMRYLVRLTRTPTGGVVLDPFMGSGTTGCACMYEGRDFIGIDLEPDYVEIARRRIEYHAQEATKGEKPPKVSNAKKAHVLPEAQPQATLFGDD